MMSGIKQVFGFGGSKDEQRMGDRRSPTRDAPSHNTRGSQRHSPTRQAHHGAASQHGGESMDCDDYTTSSNLYGTNPGLGNQYGSQQMNQRQAGRQYENQWQPHSNPMQQQPGYGTGQAQAQGHIFRSAQASKQMVYEVYGNCLTMLEELESRELRRQQQQPLPRSDIPLPSQKKHDDSTIQRKLETQLLLFQSQLISCDKGIKEEVRQELKENTLVWNSQREHRKVPQGMTDRYAGKLFEVLEKGKTEHPKEFYQTPSIDEKGMRNAMQGIVKGNHRRSELDDDFKKNPNKKAQGHKVRSGGGLDQGAERMARNNPHLAQDMEKYQDSLR